MACDACVWYCQEYGGWKSPVRLMILVQLAFVLLQSSLAIAQPDGPYYSYDVTSRCQNLVDDDEISHIFHTDELDGAELSRTRRYVGREPEPTVQDPSSEHPVINAGTVTTVNVTYSTDKVTPVISTVNPIEQQKVTTTTTERGITGTILETPKTSKNPTVVVSSPMNPATGQPVHVWANQTRWANATGKPDEKQENVTKVDTIVTTTESGPTKAHSEKEGTTKPNVEKSETKVNNRTTGIDVTSPQSTNTTDDDLNDMSISKFSDPTNNTLAQNNITKTRNDTHSYYHSTFYSDEKIAKMYWVDLDNHPDRQVNDLLSTSHRRAATVKLKFDFPFYGHMIRNITIATGGFLYTGEYLHNWLAATQYVAPLMANFDTRLSNASWVKYVDNGTAFTVEWEEVILQDKQDAGGFTFQATLYDNGNIVFVYSKIPLTVEAIQDTAHPVKVGLSDAYIMDRTIFFVRRKTIYEYHRVNFNREEISNWTVIYLRALPTCLTMDNCNDCLTGVPGFDCKWCPELNQCSNGTFRLRQDWLEKGCEQRNIHEPSHCPATQKPYTANLDSRDHPGHVHSDTGFSSNIDHNAAVKADHMNMGVSGIIGILLVVSLIGGLTAWGGYAYRNPHSASGQMLIRYRPSQWSWRRGEARYTAATIHM